MHNPHCSVHMQPLAPEVAYGFYKLLLVLWIAKEIAKDNKMFFLAHLGIAHSTARDEISQEDIHGFLTPRNGLEGLWWQ